MGITIVQKSDLRKKRPQAQKALILAGGAITGGSFKAGGLKALDDYLTNFKVIDFDQFVGISSGSFLAAPLSAGIPPHSILRSLDGTSSHFSALHNWHCYQPNFEELIRRPLAYAIQMAVWLPGKIWKAATCSDKWTGDFLQGLIAFLREPNINAYQAMVSPLLDSIGADDMPSLASLLPSGVFDNAALERYIRFNIRKNKLTNNFQKAYQASGKKLYICAMAVDGAKRVIFGHDEKSDVTISEAVMASTAMPGFYRPANIQGVDYVDGGVQETANIDIAVKNGAELIVCYNPFRPYQPEEFVEKIKRKQVGAKLSESGIMAVLNQIFRSFFYTRLHVALKKFENDPKFTGDIILIEPRSDDTDFFMLNPLAMGNRIKAAQLGFQSVHNSISENYVEVKSIFAAYGIELNRERIEQEYQEMISNTVSEEKVRRLLESRS